MKSEFFRACSGAVIINNGSVLAFERSDYPGVWQMPQGGVDKGEKPSDAVYREIMEETALTKEHIKFLEEYPDWIAYELPKPTEKHGLGQIQKWTFFEFIGNEKDIVPQEPEFVAKKWIKLGDLINETTPFRREIYKKLLSWGTEKGWLQ